MKSVYLEFNWGKITLGDVFVLTMKDCERVAKITLVGLFVAVLVYPLLHELGHTLMAVVLGADILESTLWPIPSVLCNMRGLSTVKQILVGAGGLLLPIILSIGNRMKKFWVWYSNLILLGIEILSVIISLIAIFSFELGKPLTNEDITTILSIAPYFRFVYLVALIVLMFLLTIHLIRQAPFARMREYLEI